MFALTGIELMTPLKVVTNKMLVTCVSHIYLPVNIPMSSIELEIIEKL